jgi:hypothetical protein
MCKEKEIFYLMFNPVKLEMKVCDHYENSPETRIQVSSWFMIFSGSKNECDTEMDKINERLLQ